MAVNQQLNIIVAGKSGVGKSSFLNYLIGAYKFETGSGEPVTQQYFQEESYTDGNKVTYNLYDTKGLEPIECEKSKEIIVNKIEECDKDTNIFHWIHSVYYCISAVGRRIEPFETKLIKELKEKCSIVVLLTKSDKVDSNILDEMKQELYREISNEVQIIPVCSVEERTRKGTSKQFGREEVLRASFSGLWNKLALTLPKRLTRNITSSRNETDNLSDTIRKRIEDFFGVKRTKSESSDSQIYQHIESLYKLPNMSPRIKNLERGDREAIEGLLDKVTNSLNFLEEAITTFDVDDLWKTQENIIEKVFDFYDKVNSRNKPKVLFLHRAKTRLNELKKYNISKKVKKIKDSSNMVKNKLEDVENCLFFDTAEKKAVIPTWNNYRDQVVQLGYDLKELLFKFEATFEAELYQYGQYCIREF